jgi:hypothetical protein
MVGDFLLGEQLYFCMVQHFDGAHPSLAHMLRQITLFYYYLLEWRGHPLGLGVCLDAHGFMAWWILFLEGCCTWEVVLGGSYECALALVVIFDTWSTLLEHPLLVHM